MKSCLPNPSDAKSLIPIHQPSTPSPISSLPDDLLLDCLSRLPSSSIPPLSSVCRRWSRLLLSPHFLNLRRRLNLLQHSLHAISAIDSGLLTAVLESEEWKVSLSVSDHNNQLSNLSHSRAVAIGPRVYIMSRNSVVRFDSWLGTLTFKSPMIHPRKKFAIAAINGKIYVAGGGCGLEVASAVEEYDPVKDRWEIVTSATRKRYGCIGASVESVFYVIGGLRMGKETSRAGAHVYVIGGLTKTRLLFEPCLC